MVPKILSEELAPQKVVLRLSEYGDVIETQKMKVCRRQSFLPNSVPGRFFF